MLQCRILTKSCIKHILDLQGGIELQRTLNAFQPLSSYMKIKTFIHVLITDFAKILYFGNVEVPNIFRQDVILILMVTSNLH